MRILRSVTYRGFTVGTAGWFTITSPNRWFAASRMPRRSRYLSEEFQAIERREAPRHPESDQESPTAPRIMTLPARDRSPLRQVLIVLAAITITLVLLCWIARPR